MSIWKDISKGIADFAPTIAQSILPGPVGGIASIGIKALTDKLGITEEEAKDPKKIKKAVENITADQALSLKKEENEFLIKMESLGIDKRKLYNSEMQSARDREIKTGDSKDLKTIAWVFIIGFFISVIAMFVLLGFSSKLGMSAAVFAAVCTQVGNTIGMLSAKVNQILSYFFGDSASGSSMGKELTKTLNKNIYK